MALHAAFQFGGVCQFLIAVADLDAVQVQLESFRDGWVAFTDSSQSRLSVWIVDEKDGRQSTQPRFNHLRQQQVEPAVSIIVRQSPRRFDAVSCGQVPQFTIRGLQDRCARESRKRVVVGQPEYAFGRLQVGTSSRPDRVVGVKLCGSDSTNDICCAMSSPT